MKNGLKEHNVDKISGKTLVKNAKEYIFIFAFNLCREKGNRRKFHLDLNIIFTLHKCEMLEIPAKCL